MLLVNFRNLWPGKKLLTSSVRLCSHSGEPVPVVWRIECGSELKKPGCNLSLLVVKGERPSLFGRNGFSYSIDIRRDWQEI